jgi:opacity protein-like surface antigen
MKKRNILFLSLIVVFSLPFNVSAADDTRGIYIAATGGLAIPNTATTTFADNVPGVGSTTQDISLNMGWLAGARIGWQTPFTKRWFAFEVEYNHIENRFDTGKIYTIANTSLVPDGKVKLDLVMLNFLARYPTGRFHPYMGLGGGYADVQLTDITSGFGAASALYTTGGSKWVFAYQLLAGIDFDITKNVFMGVGYKYLAASKAQFDTTITSPLAPGLRHPGSIETEYKSHNVVLTVGFLF